MKILLVSPFFVPFSGVAALRMTSFANFLIKNDVEVWVMRNAINTYPKDEINSDIIKDIKYYDVDVKGNFNTISNIYKNAINRLLNKEKFDFAVFSCGPFYTIKAAVHAKIKFNLDYILDFRDLWIYEKRRYNNIKLKLIRLISMPIEKKGIKYSSKVVVVCDGDKYVMEKYYKKDIGKVDIIYNGYDDEKLKDITINKSIDDSKNKKSVFTIATFGKFGYYAPQYIETFFSAIKKLTNLGINIKVLHIGKNENQIFEILSKYDLNTDIYENTGNMEYLQGLKKLINNSDAFFMIYTHVNGLGTKVFDYIFCNKPIITISPSNIALANMIREFENGFVCQTSNDIVDNIIKIIDYKIDILDTRKNIKKYARSLQNKRYFDLLINLINEKSI